MSAAVHTSGSIAALVGGTLVGPANLPVRGLAALAVELEGATRKTGPVSFVFCFLLCFGVCWFTAFFACA